MHAILVFLHVMGVTFWVGGIFVYALALMPSLKAIAPAERGKLMNAYIKRFAILTWVAIAFVVITGIILIGGSIGFSALFSFSNRYANVLLAKIILALLLLINGVYIGMVLGPKIASFAPPPGAPGPAGPDAGGPPHGPPPALLKLQKRMNAQLWASVGLAVATLLANGLL